MWRLAGRELVSLFWKCGRKGLHVNLILPAGASRPPVPLPLLHSSAPLSPQLSSVPPSLVHARSDPVSLPWLHVTPSAFKQRVCGSLRKLNLTKEYLIRGLNLVLNKSLSTQMGLLKDGFRKRSLGVLLF